MAPWVYYHYHYHYYYHYHSSLHYHYHYYYYSVLLFRDAVKLRYDWDVPDMPSVCVCGDHSNVDHAMICRRSGFVIQRHNELRDLEAEMLRMVCNGVEIEPVLQDITGEELNRGANTAPDARLDIVARGFWERQMSAFFDVRICHPNADSYRDMDLNQIYRQHETEKRR